MQTRLLPGEALIKEGAANLQRGIETVGGRLYLTDRRVIFESHRFNIQTGDTIVPLQSIAGVRKCWTKFLNVLPIMPNSIAVSTDNGSEYRFVVWSRQGWIDEIERQRAESPRAPGA